MNRVCGSRELADESVRSLSFYLLESHAVYVSHVTIHRHNRSKGIHGSRKRGRQGGGGGGKPDVSFACEPNDLWCWDITWLRRDEPWQHYYAYLIEDYVSRFIVGSCVSESLDSRVATELWDEAIVSEGLVEHPKACWPTSLSDRGGQMKSRHTKRYFGRNGMLQLFSRPRTPNDNPEIESLFSTMKTRPDYPGRFTTIEEARAWLARFVSWYNFEHRHSSLGYVTPDQRHRGVHQEVIAERKRLIDQCLSKRVDLNRRLRAGQLKD